MPRPQQALVLPQRVNGDPMSQWGDIFQRVTSELATDTMEIANLDNQVIKILDTFVIVSRLAKF
jgi:hypothetical protein